VSRVVPPDSWTIAAAAIAPYSGLRMRGAGIAIAAVLAAGIAAAPAAAMPAGGNAKPRVLSAVVTQDGAAVSVAIVGRDRDDVVRGAEVSWGEGQPGQGLSACSITRRHRADRRRRGKKAEFELSYAYPAAGDYTISVRVYSGGCGKRPEQRSAARVLAVHVG
jgi:hypothetical protein